MGIRAEKIANDLDTTLERLWQGEPAGLAQLSGAQTADGWRKFLRLAADESAHRPLTLLRGAVFGSYRLRRVIGRGGTSVVYEAYDEISGRPAAVKVFLDLDAGAAAALEAESRALLRMNHPGVVKVYAGGQTPSGICYLARELVDGASLLEFADGRGRAAGRIPLNLWQRVSLLCRICESVAYAHDRKVIHGDLKPGNIFITNEGAPKLLDFGLAKLKYLMSSGQSGGAPLGTWRYMSPEQACGSLIDERSDVYSLGVLGYELLLGVPPIRFGSSDPAARVRLICNHTPRRPSELNAAVRGPLEAALLRAMDRDRRSRFADAATFLQHLVRALDAAGQASLLSSRLRARGFTTFERARRRLLEVFWWRRLVEMRRPS